MNKLTLFSENGPLSPTQVDNNFTYVDGKIDTGLTSVNTRVTEEVASLNGKIDTVATATGYTFVGDYAVGVVLTQYNQIVRAPDGEFWRVDGSVGLPYTLTGDGVPEGGKLVSVGDAALRQQISAPTGAGMVGFGDTTVADAVLKPLANYAALRAYTGDAKGIRITQSGIAGDFFRLDSGVDNGGTIIVDGSGRAWGRGGGWRSTGVLASWFGFVGNNAADPIAASITVGAAPPYSIDATGPFQKALDYCTDNGLTFVVDQRYYIKNYLQISSNARIVFVGDGELVAAVSDPVMGGFFVRKLDSFTSSTQLENVQVSNLNLDLNGQSAMNGLALSWVRNSRFFGASRIKNSLYSTVYKGGRAVQIEGKECKDVHIESLYLDNCSIGVNSQALASPSDYVAKNISIGKVVMQNVGLPFNVDSTGVDSNTVLPNRMSLTVGLAVLYNCGRPMWVATADRFKGGLITGDRGSGLNIDKMRVVNDDSYGLVGGLFKGVMYGIRVTDAEIYGQFNRIADFTRLDIISGSSAASLPSWVDAYVSYRGGLSPVTEIIETSEGGNSLGQCRLTVKISPSNLTRVTGVNAGFYKNTWLSLIDATNGRSYAPWATHQFRNFGNDFSLGGSIRGERHVQAFKASMGSGVAAGFFLIPLAANGRASARISTTVGSGQNATDAACYVTSAVVALVRDGAGNLTTAVSSSGISASALDGYTSLAVTYSAVVFNADSVSLRITQTNDKSEAMGVYASAEITSMIAGATITVSDDVVV